MHHGSHHRGKVHLVARRPCCVHLDPTWSLAAMFLLQPALWTGTLRFLWSPVSAAYQ